MGPVWAVIAGGATLRDVGRNVERPLSYWGGANPDEASDTGAATAGLRLEAETGGEKVKMPGERFLDGLDFPAPRKEKMPP